MLSVPYLTFQLTITFLMFYEMKLSFYKIMFWMLNVLDLLFYKIILWMLNVLGSKYSLPVDKDNIERLHWDSLLWHWLEWWRFWRLDRTKACDTTCSSRPSCRIGPASSTRRRSNRCRSRWRSGGRADSAGRRPCWPRSASRADPDFWQRCPPPRSGTSWTDLKGSSSAQFIISYRHIESFLDKSRLSSISRYQNKNIKQSVKL